MQCIAKPCRTAVLPKVWYEFPDDDDSSGVETSRTVACPSSDSVLFDCCVETCVLVPTASWLTGSLSLSGQPGWFLRAGCRLQSGRRQEGRSFRGRSKIYRLSKNRSDWRRGPTSVLLGRHRDSLTGVTRPVREVHLMLESRMTGALPTRHARGLL